MKALIIISLMLFATTSSAEAVTKRVCHTDPKTKKEVCKNVKTHKKFEGTKVPERAPSKPQQKKK